MCVGAAGLCDLARFVFDSKPLGGALIFGVHRLRLMANAQDQLRAAAPYLIGPLRARPLDLDSSNHFHIAAP